MTGRFRLLAAAAATIAVLSVPESAARRRVEAKVGPEVEAALAASGRARVIVLLDALAPLPAEPRSRRGLAAPADLERLRSEASLAEERALAALGPQDLALSRRFRTVPALAGEVTARGLEKLRRLPGVERIDIDERGSGSLAETVPFIHADVVHDLGYTGKGVTVAVVDTGVDTGHPDLSDDLAGEACFCSGGGGCCLGGASESFGPGAAEDDNGHGSNVAGIVTSAGRVAPKGTAPDAKIVAVKALDSQARFFSSDVIAALDWILDSRADVDLVNLSLGTDALHAGACDGASASTRAFAVAIDNLRGRGVLVFAASGNEGSGSRMVAPACIRSAIAVGAVYDLDYGSVANRRCTDASTGPDVVTCFTNSDASTDLAAPGTKVTSAWLSGGTSTFSGTSQASPHAAGCAADLLEAFPSVAPDVLEATMKATGVPVTDRKNGVTLPRLDCLAALGALRCADADSDGECDLEITLPRDGGVTCADPPPTVVWNSGAFDRYRVSVSWDPTFRARRTVTSGDTLLRSPSWTIPASKWTKLCAQADPALYVRVFAKSRATGASSTSATASLAVK